MDEKRKRIDQRGEFWQRKIGLSSYERFWAGVRFGRNFNLKFAPLDLHHLSPSPWAHSQQFQASWARGHRPSATSRPRHWGGRSRCRGWGKDQALPIWQLIYIPEIIWRDPRTWQDIFPPRCNTDIGADRLASPSMLKLPRSQTVISIMFIMFIMFISVLICRWHNVNVKNSKVSHCGCRAC